MAKKTKPRIKKANLPTKICKTCQRPFSWRKKWERDWEGVLYCSSRCRSSWGLDRKGVMISTN